MDGPVLCQAYLGGTKLVAREKLRFRPSVYGLVVREGQLLVVTLTRSGKCYPPGGGVEVGEPITAALRREVREETGIEAGVGELAGFRESFFYFDPLDEAYQSLSFFYHCTALGGELRRGEVIDDGEVADPRWVDLATLRAEDIYDYGATILNMLTGRSTGP